MLTNEPFLREVGEVLHSDLTVDEESLLTVLLDIVELCQFVINLVKILLGKLDLNIAGVVVNVSQVEIGLLLLGHFLLKLGCFDLCCLGEGTRINVILGLLAVRDDACKGSGNLAAKLGAD